MYPYVSIYEFETSNIGNRNRNIKSNIGEVEVDTLIRWLERIPEAANRKAIFLAVEVEKTT